jgi:hypothetical protein
MINVSPDDKVYPVIKLATVIGALAGEGIPAQDALAGVGVSREAMFSPATRISLNQVIECLSFPKIISARSDDAIRTRLVW